MGGPVATSDATSGERRAVRVGLIGAGAWARTCHLPVVAARRPEVELVAVADADRDRADAAARDFGFAHSYSVWSRVFDHSLDACIIASPAVAHYEQALAALQSGAHVLVEKPMTLRTVHATALVEAARSHHRALLIGFGWNYSAMFAQARRLYRGTGIGALEHVSVHMASGTRDLLQGHSLASSGSDTNLAVAATWTDPAVSGGGYGHAQLSHAFGVLFGIVDDPIAHTHAYAMVPQGSRVETDLAISGTLRSGATIAVSGASFHAGFANGRHQLELRLFGSEGNMLIDFGRDVVQLWRVDGGGESVPLAASAGVYDGTGPAQALIDIALGIRAVDERTGEVGLRTVEALESAYLGLAAADPVAAGEPGRRTSVSQDGGL